jgi:hypothetical protein
MPDHEEQAMCRSRIRFPALLLLAAGTVALAGGPPSGAERSGISVDELFPGAKFDPAVPTQRGRIGFEHAERPLRHSELIAYLKTLAELSPRAVLREYSTTHEGRPMVYLAIGDEATIARLDEFREEHVRRLDPRGRAAREDAKLIEPARAVAWMAYGIHGDELSSVDAASAVAYWLVAGEDELAREIRRETVVLIDPCENPDGRERHLAQTTAFAHATPNPDAEDLSHTTVWPWGRGNHYLFDLNRDWFSLVQPESRRSSVIASWDPQLVVDSHEMGSHDTYLFSPPRHPFNPHLPAYHWDWADRFAGDQARALDGRGYSYYTQEWNEEFFPGYGSSWASYRGAIGILYEMARTAGTLVHQRPGTVRTYAEAVEHQVASSVANLTTLARNRADLLADFVRGRREVIERGRKGPVGAWVLPEGRHPQRTRDLVRLLRDEGIEVLRATTSPPQVAGLRDARTGDGVDAKELPDATWLVPADQPAGALVRALLDPHVPMEASFFREEREYLERGKGTRLYEITAWSLPLGYGIEAHWTPARPASGWSAEPVPSAAGSLKSVSEPYGYVIDGRPDDAIWALADLLQQGVAVRVAERPFRIEGMAFDRGAFLIKHEGNPDDLDARLADVATRHPVVIQAVSTAKAEDGPDLGGRYFHPLVAPRVGIWTGAPVSPSSYGALWHLFDERLGLRFSGLELIRFNRVDLARYNVLIFPPTFRGAGAYRELLGPGGLERLKAWMEAGGTAIGIGSGAEFLADERSELTGTRLRRQALETYPPVVLGPSAELVARGGNFRAVGLRAEPDDEKDDKGDGASPARESPYDVAPVIGAGAAPFAEGFERGTPVDGKPVDLAHWLKPFLPPGKSKPEKEDLERADARLRRFSTRGTFVRIELDDDAWLTWGLGENELSALIRASDTLVAAPPVRVAARFADIERLHLGGLLWPEAAARLAHTAYVTREGVGRGQVILFLNEPVFRGWTPGTRRLLVNAILYGPGLGTRWSAPW